jgi:hypothetical protein
VTGTSFAPRIDARLRAAVASAPAHATAAETTRAVGDLAWTLGLPRPSYQQVRMLLARPARPAPGVATRRRSRLSYVLDAIDRLYEYPAPGMGDWYKGYVTGGL